MSSFYDSRITVKDGDGLGDELKHAWLATRSGPGHARQVDNTVNAQYEM
jgi:hypothetical protein